MNKVTLIGRVAKDIELKYTPGNNTAVCSFNLAVDNYNSATKEKGADFIPVVIWGKQAENTVKYCAKGSRLAISGRISIRSYDAKDGTKRYVTEVVADMFNGVEFIGTANQGGASVNVGSDPDFSEPVDDGNLPF